MCYVKYVFYIILVFLLFFQEVEEFSVRSSIFSCEVAKLVLIILHDVRINVHVRALLDRQQSLANKTLDFCDMRIPSFIITLAQVIYKYFNVVIVV